MQIPKLSELEGLFHSISESEDGNLSYFFNGQAADKNNVFENRKKFFEIIGIDINKTIGIWVEGEDRVLVVDPMQAGISMTDKEHAVRCDALITNKKNLYLFLLIADCLPVILYDPTKQVLGIVHVGWRGADLEIVKKTLNHMEEVYGTDPKDLIIGFGPSARKESYIKENPSQKDDLKWKDFLEEVSDGKFKVDVSGFCRQQLLDLGVLKGNIFDCGIDTISDIRFFSHYRQNKLAHTNQGRFACVVSLV